MLQLATFWGRLRAHERHDGKTYCALPRPRSRAEWRKCANEGGHDAGITVGAVEPLLNCTFAGRKFKYLAVPCRAAVAASSVLRGEERVGAWENLGRGLERGGTGSVLNQAASLQPPDKRSHACARAPARRVHVWSTICGFAMSMRQITRL